MKLIALMLWLVGSLTLYAQPGSFYEDFEAYDKGNWEEGSVHGQGRVMFTGSGNIGIATDGSKSTSAQVLFQKPKSSTAPSETHASMVVSEFSVGDFDLALDVKTVEQLRAPTPNAWEAAWVLWHYTDNAHFYYFILKSNGWELGKEDPAYPGNQRFLVTGAEPKLVVGQYNRFQIQQKENAILVGIDGRPVVSFIDRERPYLAGRIGLYNEDAFVHFDSVLVRADSALAVEASDPIPAVNDFVVQNYPNPFNAMTVIAYQLPYAAPVKLEVFSVKGERVKVLVNERQEAGIHRMVWNAAHHPSGIYFYQLSISGRTAVGKLLLVR